MMMSIFIKEFVKKKLNQLSYEDLLHYSAQYGFSLTQSEAKNISAYIKTNQLDPFVESDRIKMFEDLAQITDPNTAKKANDLLAQIIRTYGLEHLFQ